MLERNVPSSEVHKLVAPWPVVAHALALDEVRKFVAQGQDVGRALAQNDGVRIVLRAGRERTHRVVHNLGDIVAFVETHALDECAGLFEGHGRGGQCPLDHCLDGVGESLVLRALGEPGSEPLHLLDVLEDVTHRPSAPMAPRPTPLVLNDAPVD